MQAIKQRRVGVLVLTLLFIAILAFIAMALINTTDDDPFNANAIVNPPFESLTYGVQAFLWWNPNFTGRNLDEAQLMSFTHIKQTFAWRDIEPNQDEWHFGPGDRIMNEIEGRGLHMIARLSDAPSWAFQNHLDANNLDADALPFVDSPPDNVVDYADYCHTVATRYRGRIAAYQVWNEPNLEREWGGLTPNAGDYVELLRACSDAIREADPDAVIISAGLAPTGRHDDLVHRDDIYLQEMYNLNFQNYIDVVGVHAPGYNVASYGPDDAEANGEGRWATFRRVEDLRKIMINNGDSARQIAILEMGYTTDPRVGNGYEWFAVSEDEQATRMIEAYQYIADHWRPWVGLVSAIYIPNPEWTTDDEQYYWSLTDPQMIAIRPVFDAIVHMPRYCGDIIAPTPTFTEAGHISDNACN